jgi:hypothetical protein
MTDRPKNRIGSGAAKREWKFFSLIRFCPQDQVFFWPLGLKFMPMDTPKAPAKPDLTRVTFYSFTGDPRPATVCKREEITSHESHPLSADEGFSTLMGALRRTQVGNAAQTMDSRRNYAAVKYRAIARAARKPI